MHGFFHHSGRCGLACAALLCSAWTVRSGSVPLSSAADGVSISLEEVPYPYQVHFFPVSFEGEPVRMAFMDVAPVNAGNGQTVLLLHGKNFYGSYWEGPIRWLTRAGYRVIVPDQIGFGKSSKPTTTYTFDALARHTAALLDNLEIHRVIVIGHSMGGMLGIHFAYTYPGRTSHLVLENPIGLEDYRQLVPARTTEQVYQGEYGQPSDEFRKYVTAYFAHPKPEWIEPFVDVRDRLTRSGEFPRWAMSAALTYQMIYEQPVRHELGQLSCPVLLVIGQTDRTAVGKAFAPPEVRDQLGNYPKLGKRAAAEVPNLTLVELPDVGHIPHFEAPEKFEKSVLGFLR